MPTELQPLSIFMPSGINKKNYEVMIKKKQLSVNEFTELKIKIKVGSLNMK